MAVFRLLSVVFAYANSPFHVDFTLTNE